MTPPRHRPCTSLAALGLVLALAPSATAQTLLVGGPDGLVHEVPSHGGAFAFVGTCGGPINSMILLDEELHLADSNGLVYAFDVDLGVPTSAFAVASDATALVADGPDLLVSGSDGTVRRVDPATGVELDSFSTVSSDLQAMTLSGTELIAGSWDSSILLADPAVGVFSHVGACGGQVNSMARDGDDVWIGARHFADPTTGHVYHYAVSTGVVSYRFDVDSDAVALIVEGADLLVAGSDGTILRVDAATGAVSDTLVAPVPVEAMVLRPVGVPLPLNYCETSLNSTGAPAIMSWSGTIEVGRNDLVLEAGPMQPDMNGVFLQSPDQVQLPFGNGILCVGNRTLGFVVRLGPEISDAAGVMRHALDVTSPSTPVATILPGSTWSFSCWYRDIPAGGTYYDFADGLQVTFAP